MELLDLQSFIPKLSTFSSEELLTPIEASKLLFTITELLIDHYVDYPLLKFLSRFLTQESYDDIVEERNIEHQCGYILCNQTPKQQVRRLSSHSNGVTVCSNGGETKFQIYNRKPSIILPNTFLSQYCCKDHYQASLFFRNQLSQEAVFARKNIMVAQPFPQDYPSSWFENGITSLEEILAKHRELKSQGKSIADVVKMMNGLSMEDDQEAEELIKLIEDFEIVEKESNLNGDVDFDDDDEDSAVTDGPTSKIEGYITSNKSFGGYMV